MIIQEAAQSAQKEAHSLLKDNEVKKLINLRKKEQWRESNNISSLVTVRDILEFSLMRDISIVINTLTESLYSMDKANYTRKKAEEKFHNILDENKSKLTEKQVELLTQAKDVLLNKIDQVNEWLATHTKAEIKEQLGPQFKIADELMEIDTDAFPGAVVVKIFDMKTYASVVGQLKREEDPSKLPASGRYNNTYGLGVLQGSIIVVNQTKETSSTQDHEYQHFLFKHTSDSLEYNIPNKSKNKIELKKLEKNINQIQEKIFNLEDQLEEEYEIYQQINPETNKKLKKLNKRLRLIQNRTSEIKANSPSSSEYSKPFQVAFKYFKNEFLATYSHRPNVQEVLSLKAKGLIAPKTSKPTIDYQKIFGPTLHLIKNDDYFETFKDHTRLFKNAVHLAKKKGVSEKRIAFLLTSANTMIQAAKFVFLEMKLEAN